jgi:hypothetical protein
MYLRKVIYQMQTNIESLIPSFHRSHRRNLALMVVGMVYAKSVNLPQIASYAKPADIQLESRVQRFERVLKCRKLVPLEALKPISKRVLETVCKSSKEPLMILMDRSMINDTLNLLWMSVGFGGRALPLGWILVPHEGNSDLALQQELLNWLKEILPEKAKAVIVADREFHSIRLAEWLEKELKLDYALRIKAGTYIEFDGEMLKTSELAIKGESFQMSDVKITKDGKLTYRTKLTVHWAADEDEPWCLATNLDVEESLEVYAKRFWIEEMFSDHKSRGLNLEKTRLTDANRLQKLLVAVTIAYLWLMEIGFSVVSAGNPKQVDNKGAERSVSLCQIGLRWLRELLNDGLSPPLFTANFGGIGMA